MSEHLHRASYGSSSPSLSSPPTDHSHSNQNGAHDDELQPPVYRSALPSYDGAQDGSGDDVKSSNLARTIVKRPRKKRDPDASASSTTTTTTADGALKEKKKRAKRGTSAAYLRKQARIREEAEVRARRAGDTLQSPQPTRPIGHAAPPKDPHQHVFSARPTYQNGNHEAIPTSHTAANLAPHSAAPVRPASGQKYDPIRSLAVAGRPPSPPTTTLTPTKHTKTSSASASPSISNLTDPTDSKPYYEPRQPSWRENSDLRPESPPDAKRVRLTPPAPAPAPPPPSAAVVQHRKSESTPEPPSRKTQPTTTMPMASASADAMDVDVEPRGASNAMARQLSGGQQKSLNDATTAVSSTAHSPKPARSAREPTVPLPTGSGLLSGEVFGGSSALESSGKDGNSSSTAPTVVLTIPLKGQSNQYVNFAKLAEERYGFNALHPRLAAQREHLARVAAAGAALENAHKLGVGGQGQSTGSADDKSVDLSNDEGDDSNVEMGGTGNGGQGGDGTKSGADDDTGRENQPVVKQPRRKRVMKEDMYDKDDDFIDDTEQAWEEQAAVSKDGFFVYSGLLVPEGEEAKIERADASNNAAGAGTGSTTSSGRTRGSGSGRGGSRGRGGGPGSRGGRGAATMAAMRRAAAAAAAANGGDPSAAVAATGNHVPAPTGSTRGRRGGKRSTAAAASTTSSTGAPNSATTGGGGEKASTPSSTSIDKASTGATSTGAQNMHGLAPLASKPISSHSNTTSPAPTRAGIGLDSLLTK